MDSLVLPIGSQRDQFGRPPFSVPSVSPAGCFCQSVRQKRPSVMLPTGPAFLLLARLLQNS